MATLTGNQIKDTYKSLLKVDDNGELAATLQEITDGNGNGSGVSLNTEGDLKATGTLEFGSLKDTGEAITITKFVDEADGIANNDNDTSIPTSAAVVDYVAAKITLEDLDFAGDTGTGSVDLDSQTFTISGTANEIETSGSGQTLTVGLVDSPTVSGTITAGTITDGTASLTGGTLTGDLTGTVTGTSVLADGVTGTTQATSDDSTKIATTAFVKSVLTLEDLDFQGDSGTGSVDLDSQSLDIAGGTGIDTVASGQTLTVNIDSTVATLTGTQTLTNKTIDADNNTISNLEVDNLKTGVLDTDLSTVSASDDTIASAKAIKTYVDEQVTAQDLDFGADTGTGSVDLDSQSLTVSGGTGIDTTASGQDVSIAIDSTVVTLTGTQELTNKTINADSNTVTNLEVDNLKAGVLDTDLTTVSASDDTLASAKAIKTYVDSQVTAQDLDITDGTTTSAVDLDSQTMTIQGTTNEVEVGLVDQTFTIGLPDDVVIAGDLTVNGTTTTVNTETLSVKDPLIEMANDNAANTVDTGFYANYSLDAGVTTKFAGLFKDASDSDTFKLFKGLEVEPTTTVDTAGTGYSLADLDVAGLSASSGVISGDLTVDTNTLYVDSADNRVGIGTLDPQVNLQVEGTIMNYRSRYSTNAGASYWDVRRDSSTGNFVISDDGLGDVIEIAQATGNVAIDTNTLYVDSSNNRVGIGTTNPASLLHLESANSPVLRIKDTTQGVTLLAFSQDTNSHIGTYSNHDLVLDTNSTERLRITSNGLVGIGTSSPNYKLSVDDDSITSAPKTLLQFKSANIDDGGGYDIDFRTSSNDLADRFISRIRGVREGAGAKSQLSFWTDDGSSLGQRMTINSSGNVGIGTANSNYRFNLSNSSTLTPVYQQFTNGTTGTTANDGTVMGIDSDGDFIINNLEAKDVRLYTSDTERMRIDSSGNVCIGDGNVNNTWSVGKAFTVYRKGSSIWTGYAGETDIMANVYYDGGYKYANTGAYGARINVGNTNGDIAFYNTNVAGTADTTVTLNERMRITSEGNVLFGTTGTPGSSVYGSAFIDGGSGLRQLFQSTSTTNVVSVQRFYNPNGNVGSIQLSGFSTSYVTSSDYRLKENVVPMEGALDRVDALKPSRFNFIADADKTVDGFLAHEVAEVVPEAISGEKDAVDEEGNAIYQGIDQSKLVPLLVGAIQELRAEIETLKSQINK